MNDSDVLEHIRDSLADIRMRTPVDAIVARGRRRQLRRSVSFVSAAVAVAAIVVGTQLLSEGRPPLSGDPSVQQPLQLAAYSVITNPDGTVTLTLRKPQDTFDADILRDKLADAGVPAEVRIGEHCSVESAASLSSALDRAVRGERRTDGSVVLIITPSAMPEGSELSIGMFAERQTWSLLWADAPMTCTDALPGQDGDTEVREVG
jgi:hypothetical protein